MDIRSLSRHERRAAQKQLAAENRKRSSELVALDRSEYLSQAARSSVPILGIWRSNKFLVQVYDEKDRHLGCVRLSVLRTETKNSGDWEDGITWDDLQDVKKCLGYGKNLAVEVYPADRDLVNVANIRHLWVFTEECPIDIFWKDGEA